MKSIRLSIFLLLDLLFCSSPLLAGNESHIYVDPNKGNDKSVGSRALPVRSLYGAIGILPEKITQDITIHLTKGIYNTTGMTGNSRKSLELNRIMPDGVKVRIVSDSEEGKTSKGVILNWRSESSDPLITVTQGHWALENIQIGSRQADQRGGITTTGPAILELHNIRIHTIGQKGCGICASYGGRIFLYGNIELNEDLQESGGNDENFCRIEAEYNGIVKYIKGQEAKLILGNGNLSAAYYGIIELGCEQAFITSWNYQSNPIAINNSGRIDLHNTTTRLCARNARNTPIGLEHDGHVLAEGARIIIDGQDNSNAIVLQKASSFFCNDVEIKGKVRYPLLAMSGSIMLVGINGDLAETFATTSSSIIIEKCTGKLLGPFNTSKFGQIVFPEGTNPSISKSTTDKNKPS